MLLQRKYHHDSNGIKPPVVRGIKLKRMSADGKQRFAPKLVKIGQDEHWLSVTGGKIIIHDEGGDVPFKVLKVPGRYCCHCGEKLTDDADGAAARKHVVEHHVGKKSPDEQNPSGYVMQNYYDCELEAQNG